jgi:hypothetical protein
LNEWLPLDQVVDAVYAGMKPEIIPITAEIKIPITMFPNDKVRSKSRALDAADEMMKTINSPINPPSMHRVTASERN